MDDLMHRCYIYIDIHPKILFKNLKFSFYRVLGSRFMREFVCFLSQDMERRQPRRKSSAKEKGKGKASGSGTPPIEGPTTNAPWPRPDGAPFTNATMTVHRMKTYPEYTRRQKGESWSDYHCVFYNQLLRNEIVPTKFVCAETLTRLGIREDVHNILERIGLGTIAYNRYPLYPELVRQFLASCDIHFDDIAHPSATEASLTYLSGGFLYEISIPDLCDVYGFNRAARGLRFPNQIPQLAELWHLIAGGGYEPRTAKLTHIRNPAVRIVAKILGAVFTCKEEPGALRTDELIMLHYGIAPAIPDLYRETPEIEHRVNLGLLFAEMLTTRRFRGTSEAPKRETIGSLLTLIFMHHGIDLSHTSRVEKIDLFSEQYFINCQYLRPGPTYKYVDRSGTSHTCRLPDPAITSVTCRANLEFLPHLDDDQPPPPIPAPRRGSSSRPSLSRREDDPVPDYFTQETLAQSRMSMEQLLPEYTGEFDLPPISDDFTDREYQRWVIESTRRNNSMMQRIWGALRKIRVPRPSCFTDPSQAEGGDDTRADADADAHDGEPVVAGHRRTDSSEDTEDETLVQRLSRRRRQPGQSRSSSPEDN